MEHFTDSYEVQALRDENQWLLQCLYASEQTCKQLQSTIKQQQRRIKQLEKASAATNQPDAAQLERQWTLRLQQKEKEWMQEYDTQMQSLLRIIQHHESTRAQLESELHHARDSTTDCASNATQTDFSSDDDDSNEEEVEDMGVHGSCQQEATHDARCSSCCDVSRLHETEKEERTVHSFAIQQLLQRLQISTARSNQANGLTGVRSSRRYVQASSNSSSALDFRTSILERLRRPTRRTLLSQSRARSLPPTIPEEDEDKDEEQDVALTKARALGIDSFQSEASSGALQSLEEQNRLLQDRLASQQTVLDQLLSSKLHTATDNAVATTMNSSTTPDVAMLTHPDQMIKLSDHFEISVQTNHHRTDILGSSHPLSPSAA